MKAAINVTPDRPILIDRFLNHALECEADAICDGERAYVPAVMEHIELAGIHSGDSACIIPSRHISEGNLATIREYTRRIAEEMHVVGLMNMQYAIEPPKDGMRRDGRVFVLEANPRASRTVPLVSKVCGIRMVPLATEIITGALTSGAEEGGASPLSGLKERAVLYYGVKESVFPFNMFPEVDPVLGPEMRSTGEVLGMALTAGEAFFKAEEAAGAKLPLSGTVLFSLSDMDKTGEAIKIAKDFLEDGFRIIATRGTCAMLREAGLEADSVKKVSEGRPNILDLIANGGIQLIVNTPKTQALARDGRAMRRSAIKSRIPYITTLAAARAASEGIRYMRTHDGMEPRSLQEWHSLLG